MRDSTKKRSEPEPILEFPEAAPHLESGGEHGALPVRTCIVERARKERPFLIRFVLSPEGAITPDIKGNLPGRGVWVTAKKQAVEQAVKRRAFQRAFRKPVVVDEDLPLRVEQLFKRSALERLSIANKAGLLVTGFSKVEEGLNRGDIAALLHAGGAAANGRLKLDRKFGVPTPGKDHIVLKNCFTSAEISLASGSSNVIHAGLKEGGASRAFLQALERLNDYCTEDASVAPLRQGRE